MLFCDMMSSPELETQLCFILTGLFFYSLIDTEENMMLWLHQLSRSYYTIKL